MVTRLLCVALVVVAAFTGGRAVAGSPDDTFQQLYGDQVRKLKADRGKGEVEFAKKLLSDANAVPDDKPFRSLLCNKAYEFASTHAEGYGVAAEAMELLAKTSPESAPAASEKALEMYEKRYTAAPVSQRKAVGPPYLEKLVGAADAKAKAGEVKEASALYTKAIKVAESVDRSRVSGIRDAMKDLGTKQASQKHLDELLAKLKASPDDAAAAGEVIQILVYERNRPADAVEVAATLQDPAAKRAIPLAAKDVADLGEPELISLAEWHTAQAAKAPDALKAAAYEQASRCYRQFLKHHVADDAGKLQAKHALEDVQRSLADADAKGPHRAVDLLKLIDPSRDKVKGTWKLAGSALSGQNAAGAPEGTVRISYKPPEEYDLRVEFTRVRGNECVIEILSHDGHSFLSTVGAMANTVCGIDVVDGKRFNANSTTKKLPQVLKSGERSVIVCEVRNRSVTVKLNGTTVIRHVTNYSDLTLFKPDWDIGDAPLGLGVYDGEVLFHSVQLTDVSKPSK